ncbi:HAMP domain-containing sensor histidine kinase [Actinomadura sp. WMMB 499]|uniref:sensor histidine kinase n=1 Tax=Actinomadura sp. WMMB 499 TaxID=1219491 RepID=UPI0012493E90|nr:ATP-binding protein [Actinomadura sp. WMMB 499]QFG23080.1 HAMP domain-containing protein [Actinomadura sp. WMMB 499]
MRLTVRARLTLLYGSLLLTAGGALITAVYVLMRRALDATLGQAISAAIPASSWGKTGRATPIMPTRPLGDDPTARPSSLSVTTERVTGAAQDTALQQLLLWSLAALAAFAVLSMLLAWWMSGRVLRPVHTITATARRLSGENLHERIALEAPPGELKDLADTFDAMLDRLEGLVAAQQRFVAGAAHELRTPLAVQRAALEIGLAGATPEKVERVRTRLLDVADRSERLIEGLLLLSTSDQGLDRPERVAVAELVTAVAEEHAADAREYGIDIRTRVEPLHVQGDPTLLRHLVRNLLENGLRYNTPGGRVDLRLDRDGLRVVNTGPPVPADAVPHLFEPFRRRRPRRSAPGEGTGLGLSIVASIARAHGGRATARPGPEGGLDVRVSLPEPADR